MMDDFSANVFNYCIGAFALFSTLVSIYRYYRSILPAQRITKLNAILTEVRDIYEKATAEDLFPSERDRQHATTRLNDLEILTNELREKAYAQTTAIQELLSLVHGLSNAIANATCTAKRMRGNLMSITEEERRRRMHARVAGHMPLATAPRPPQTAANVQAPSQIDSEASEVAQCPNYEAATTSVNQVEDIAPSRSSTLVEEARDGKQMRPLPKGFIRAIRTKLLSIFPLPPTPPTKALSEEPSTYHLDSIPPV